MSGRKLLAALLVAGSSLLFFSVGILTGQYQSALMREAREFVSPQITETQRVVEVVTTTLLNFDVVIHNAAQGVSYSTALHKNSDTWTEENLPCFP